MANRIDVNIPPALVGDYQDGRATVADLARRLGASQQAVRRELRSQGVDTSPKTRKRLKFAHRVEEAQHLLPGSAYATVAELYRQGYSTHKIGCRLNMTPRAATLILIRMGVKLRSTFYRSVFEGRMDQLPAFAERLQSLRLALGLTQKGLAEQCGLCQATIWHLEKCWNGPHWETLFKLCDGLEVEPTALGVDWEPAWLEGEDADTSAEDLVAEHAEVTAGFAAMTFQYTAGGWPPAVDVATAPVGNMMYDSVLAVPRCPSDHCQSEGAPADGVPALLDRRGTRE